MHYGVNVVYIVIATATATTEEKYWASFEIIQTSFRSEFNRASHTRNRTGMEEMVAATRAQLQLLMRHLLHDNAMMLLLLLSTTTASHGHRPPDCH